MSTSVRNLVRDLPMKWESFLTWIGAMTRIDSLTAQLAEHARDDGVIDGFEIDKVLTDDNAVYTFEMRDAMWNVISEGARFSERARARAHFGTGSLLDTPRTTDVSREAPAGVNSAFQELDARITALLRSDALQLEGGDINLRLEVQTAVIDAELPQSVRRYIAGRLTTLRNEMRGRASSQAGAAELADTVETVMSQLGIEESESYIPPVGAHLFERGTRELEDRGYFNRYDSRQTNPEHPKMRFTFMLNDVVSDGRITLEDAQSLTDRADVLLRRRYGSSNFRDNDIHPAQQAQWAQVVNQRLSTSNADPEAISHLLEWIDGRAAARKGMADDLARRFDVEFMPMSVAPSVEGIIVPDGVNTSFSEHGTRTEQIRQALVEDSSEAKLEQLLAIVREAQEELVLLAQGFEHEGVSYPVSSSDETRLVEWTRENSQSSSVEFSSTSDRAGGVSLLPLALAQYRGNGLSSGRHTAESSSDSGRIEVTGRVYDFSPTLERIEDEGVRREVGEAYVSSVSNSLMDIHRALSAAARVMVDDEHDVETDLVEAFQWAATTRFQAEYVERFDYLGPAQSRQPRVVGINRVVYPNILGAND